MMHALLVRCRIASRFQQIDRRGAGSVLAAVGTSVALLSAAGCRPEVPLPAVFERLAEPVPTGRADAIDHVCTVLAGVHDAVAGTENSARADLAAAYLERSLGWPGGDEVPAGGFEAVFRERMRRVAGRTIEVDGSSTLAARVAASRIHAPQHLTLAIEAAATAGDSSTRLHLEGLVGELLPVGLYGTGRDRLATRRAGASHGPVIPNLDRASLIEIAHAFVRLGAHRRAADAYLEAVLSTFDPPWTSAEPDGATWLSAAAADLWIRAADAAFRGGAEAESSELLAPALVFGDADAREQGRRRLVAWRQGVAAQPRAALDSDAQLTEVLAIANRYAIMALHPRALSVLREHRALAPATIDARIDDIAAGWATLVERYCAGTIGACVLFGQEVGNAARSANIEVPWPSKARQVEAVRTALASEEPSS